jgi:hypothetical protein
MVLSRDFFTDGSLISRRVTLQARQEAGSAGDIGDYKCRSHKAVALMDYPRQIHCRLLVNVAR